MNFLFPLIYSTLLFISLSVFCVYTIEQIRRIQKLEKRISHLSEKIYNDDSLYEDYYRLGQIYVRKKIYEKAILLFRQALFNWDMNDRIGLGSLYNTIGFTYFNLKDYEYALYYYHIAIKLMPDYILALTNLAFTYEKLKNFYTAKKFYQITLTYDPLNRLALSRLNYLDKANL
uniref:Ycf37 n=1 Tax=Schizocladia ischiensis TaxID=196139 RepID=A0A7S6ZPA8_9STRA|nr:Ycf37 [Schizocladia ischiensis]QOW07503.1 Ycf37 [Schizocladia ischiensis]